MEAVEEAVEVASNTVQPANDIQDDPQLSGLKTPKTSLLSFPENYSDWIPFSDLFKSTVHNNRILRLFQKPHYLKTSLEEEPVRLLHSSNCQMPNIKSPSESLKIDTETST